MNATTRSHIGWLIFVSLLAKFAVIIATIFVFGSFIDYFDLAYHFDHATPMLTGEIPYVDYPVDYPVLVFIPSTIALIVSVFFQSAFAFATTFQLFMVICDLITTVSVYYIALKLYTPRRAFYAGLLQTTAFASAYFVITKYDAFPTCLLMLGLACTIYGDEIKGYWFYSLGLFAKIFPAIALPFVLLHDAKKTTLNHAANEMFWVVWPLTVLLFVPLYFIKPESINTYLFVSGASVGVYASTLTYTLSLWIPVITGFITPLMYLVMGSTIGYLMWRMYKAKQQSNLLLLQSVFCAIVVVIICTKFHSPNYMVWFTPLLALLVVDDLYSIAGFYLVQALAYFEFPLMFGKYYVNMNYLHPAGTDGWYLTLLFFTVQYAVLIWMTHRVVAK